MPETIRDCLVLQASSCTTEDAAMPLPHLHHQLCSLCAPCQDLRHPRVTTGVSHSLR